MNNYSVKLTETGVEIYRDGKLVYVFKTVGPRSRKMWVPQPAANELFHRGLMIELLAERIRDLEDQAWEQYMGEDL